MRNDECNSIELREALEKLSVLCPGGKAEDQDEFIQNLKKKYPHSIEIRKEIPEGPADFRESNDRAQFNCFMFCLDIRYSDIKDINGSDGMRIPNSEYMLFLCKTYMTEKNNYSINNGDYVLYFSDHKIVHAGKVESSRVVSKWGNGHIWIHGFLKFPYPMAKK